MRTLAPTAGLKYLWINVCVRDAAVERVEIDMDNDVEQLNNDLAVYAEAVEHHRQQAEQKGNELWQALGIISDMIQCHPTNDAVGKRARNFLHSYGRN